MLRHFVACVVCLWCGAKVLFGTDNRLSADCGYGGGGWRSLLPRRTDLLDALRMFRYCLGFP